MGEMIALTQKPPAFRCLNEYATIKLQPQHAAAVHYGKLKGGVCCHIRLLITAQTSQIIPNPVFLFSGPKNSGLGSWVWVRSPQCTRIQIKDPNLPKTCQKAAEWVNFLR
mmetsp:Transcript_10977/g.19614  ORF Transcript_10977/g.19614 Transcript_10977/m.19614 type:complete len:110 (+) Transcript_10977:2765-3094(+)